MERSSEMRSKVCLITGANSGIGKATALGLAKLGATVVMVCRDYDRGQAARTDIVEKSRNESIDLFIADLSSQSAVRQLAEEFKAKYPRLHLLINNAGVNISRRTVTVDRIETAFAVNYLAPFLLTHLLLDLLRASAPARIINLASWTHPPIDLNDLSREKRYQQMEVYYQSKTAIVMFTYELARRIQGAGVTVNCSDPGLIRTNLGRDLRGPVRLFLALMRPFMKSSERGAEALIHLASAPEVERVTGKYFVGTQETPAFKESYDVVAAQRLWQVSEQLTRLSSAGQ